ncbi:MAG: SsrA-binding protein SmpB [Clostridia bacterium]|nr:SsrA-binding protein SmpB [Clostridia bacterium]
MNEKIIQQNKKAFFDFFVEDKFEAGIALAGSEVKSIKLGKVNLRDSYCSIEGVEIFLRNCLVTSYEKGSYFNVDEKRPRKLLLHRYQINKLIGKVKEKGYTLIPTKIYFVGHLVKVEIALAKGKHTYDKRASIKEKDIARSAERQIRERY